jgi:hypothetical protein
MDYNEFCRNADGSWNRAKEYEWIFMKVNAEYDAGSYGDYTKQVAKGDDASLIIALLYEAGIKSEGAMTPLLGKSIFTEPQETNYVFESIQNHITEERYQKLLDKYIEIKSEFIKRHKAHQADVEKKHGVNSKPKQKVKTFRLG